MADEDQYVRSAQIPAWMAASAKTIIPAALVLVVGAGLVTWQSVAVLASRVDSLEGFANRGDRFTANDGRHLEARIDQLEKWRIEHTQFGYEYVGKQQAEIREIFERLKRIDKRHEGD